MSGIFGWIAKQKNDELDQQILRMGKSLTHREWSQIETHVFPEAGAAYGRAGIGIFNKEPQPHQRKEGKLKIWFAGELFRHNIPHYEQDWNSLNDPELALLLYDLRGESVFAQLEGSYQFAIFDAQENLTFLVLDRWASYPLHYYQSADGLFFSPEFKAILTWPFFEKKMDMDALAEYVRMQRVLGTKSFFENIKRVEYGSYLKYNHQSYELVVKKFWDYSKIEQINISEDEGHEEIVRLLNAAVYRCTQGKNPTGLYLSGGLDSRMIASSAVKYLNPFHTLTYGFPQSSDVILAERVARKLGTTHHQIPFNNGKWVLDHFDDHLLLTEGYHSWPHLHGINTIEYARKHFKVQLNGFLGGLLNAYSRTDKKLKETNNLDQMGVINKYYHSLISDSSWPGLTEGEAHNFYHPEIKNAMRDRAYYTFLKEFKKFAACSPPIHQMEAISIIENAMTLYHKFVIFYRSGLEVRCPFLDYDLMTFILSAPAEIRLNTKKLFETAAPELSHIPYNKDWMPPTTNRLLSTLGEFSIKSKNLLRSLVPNIYKPPVPLNTDYEAYLRTDLKSWAEDILFDERTLSRGFFNPDFIRSIWSRTQQGEVHTLGKISPIISYELLLRKFYDS